MLKPCNMLADGVREISKPQHVQVGLPPAFSPCRLNVVYSDGTTNSLVISNKVAEVLTALDLGYEG